MSRMLTIGWPTGVCSRDSPELYALLVDTLVARLRRADEEAAAASFPSLRHALHAHCFSSPSI